ncbi:hypothetical protein Tco_0256945 [Tanacetum coccineum]
MSLDNSDNYVIPDGDPVDPALEAAVLPKFDMHLYQSSLNKTHVKCLVKCYGIPKDLHPRIVPAGMTMDRLPNDAITLYVHHFRRGGLWVPFSTFFLRVVEYFCVHISQLVPISVNRATIFEVYCRALGIVLTVPLFRVFYKLLLTMAEVLRIGDLHGCKITAEALLPPGAALETHISTPATRLEDIPAKTGAMETAEIPCRKVLADKEKNKRKAEVKAAAKADDHDDIHIDRVASKRCAGGVGASRKKRKTRVSTSLVDADSEHVSSPTPLNQSLPVVIPANEKHVSETASAARLADLQNQTDEQGSPLNLVNKNVEEPVVGEERGNDHDDVNVAIEGHGDNADGLSGLRTQPSPNNRSGPRIKSVKKSMCDKPLLDAEASYSAGRFGNLPFTPQWGLTDSSRMMHSLSNGSAIKPSWKLLCQSAQQQANALLRFEALTEEHADLVNAHESCKDLSRDYDRALIREKGLQERVEELEEEKKGAEELSIEQADRIKREVFSLAVGKGFIGGLSVGRKDEDVQTILKATPGVNPISSSTFMEKYNKLFDKRYPYVDKVARAYLLDPTGL